MKTTIFSKKHTLSDLHLDRHGRLKLSSLLFFAQDAASCHCQELMLDWESLNQKNLFWAIIRQRVQICRLPGFGETVTVKTWPMPTTRSAYPRATVGYDEKGNALFRCISLWVLMDKNTRAMVLPGKSGICVDGLLTGSELAPPSSIAPHPMVNRQVRRVGYTELDRNGHMNNTKYLEWVEDLLTSSFHEKHPARELTVCYLNEASEGQEIHLHWQLKDGPCLEVEGDRKTNLDNERQQRIFAAQVQF